MACSTFDTNPVDNHDNVKRFMNFLLVIKTHCHFLHNPSHNQMICAIIGMSDADFLHTSYYIE